ILTIVPILGLCFWKRHHSFWLSKFRFDRLGDLLPYDRVLDDNETIACKDGSLIKVFAIKPVDYSILTNADIKKIERRKNKYLKDMAGYSAHIRIYNIRDKVHHKKQKKQFPVDILEKAYNLWESSFTNFYENNHYLVLTASPSKNLKDKTSNEKNTYKKLEKLVELTEDILREQFSPKILKQDKLSPLLSFLARIAIFEKQNIAKNNDVGSSIATSHAFFAKDGIIECGDKFIKAINISTWGEECDVDIIREVLRLDTELVVSHLLWGEPKKKSLSSKLSPLYALPVQQNFAKLSWDKDKVVDQYDEVINRIKNDEDRLYYYQMTIFIEASSRDECIASAAKVRRIFANADNAINPVMATKYTSKWLYLSMHPTNNKQIYPAKFLSSTLSYWLELAGEPKGFKKSSFGEGELINFETANKGCYSLTLHQSEEKNAKGHLTIFGGTSTGKTTTISKILTGAIGQGVRVCLFDRLKGMKVFCNMAGGNHVASLNNKMNPLYCDDTVQNRELIKNWLLMMGECNDTNSIEKLEYSLNSIFKIPKQHRLLTDIVQNVLPNCELKRRLKPWIGKGSYSGWFNGVDNKGLAYDSLDLSSNQVVAFEMEDIQKNPVVSAAVTYYIMERIKREVDCGTKPHIIFIDETLPQLQVKHFRAEILKLYREIRKKNGVVATCFQDLQGFLDTGCGETMFEQTAMQMFYPGKYKEELLHKIGLNEYEINYAM
ncbi:MAG: hypothetical protein HRT87_11270, partial [Legionellales bacterium]|nr:hypothetical protein [Legionellales bacterium]